MIKKLITITALAFVWLLAAGSVWASVPVSVSIVQLPEYMNTDNFDISYTANGGTAGLTEVVVQFHKEGDGWTTLGTYTDSARTVEITPTQINEETKYYFRAVATDGDGNTDSSETSTTVDRTPPPQIEGFSKEKTGSHTYRLRWHNPDHDDVYQVYVYRSAEAGFTADSNTLVAQLSVNKDSDTSWDNAIPEDKNYFYVVRAVDRAGNAADPVGDTVVVTTSTTSGTGEVPQGEPVEGDESVTGQVLGTGTGGQVLGGNVDGDTGEDGEEPGSESEEDGSMDSMDNGQVGSDSSQDEDGKNIWPIVGLVALLLGLYWFLFRKK